MSPLSEMDWEALIFIELIVSEGLYINNGGKRGPLSQSKQSTITDPSKKQWLSLL